MNLSRCELAKRLWICQKEGEQLWRCQHNWVLHIYIFLNMAIYWTLMGMEWQWGQFNHKAILRHLHFDLSLGISYVLMKACLVIDCMCRWGKRRRHKTRYLLSNNNSKMLLNKSKLKTGKLLNFIWEIVCWVPFICKYSYIKYEYSKWKILKKHLFFLSNFIIVKSYSITFIYQNQVNSRYQNLLVLRHNDHMAKWNP